MQQVNVPGVGMLQFPDGMSQDAMSAAIQKNYPQTISHSTQSPDDSPFVKGIKDLGNEAVRVGSKAITGLPLMGADFATAIGALAKGKTHLDQGQQFPSQIQDDLTDQAFAPPQGTPGKISEGLSTLIASLGLPGPNGIRTAGDMAPIVKSLTGADAVKAEAMGIARKNGVVIPPTLTKNAPTSANLKNGWGGLTETLRQARDTNTPAINGMLAQDIGLDAGSPLTMGDKGTITDTIKDAVKAGYAPIRSLGAIPEDQAHLDLVNEIGGADRGASNISPTLGNPQIAELAQALRAPARSAPRGPVRTGQVADNLDPLTLTSKPPVGGGGLMNAPVAQSATKPTSFGPQAASGNGLDPLTLQPKARTFDAADLLDASVSLRGKAADAYAAGNRTLGAAYKKAANGMESLIDRHLQSQIGQMDDDETASNALTNFRIARTRIAKSHDILGALNQATGDVDPRLLAGLDRSMLTGGVKDAATIGGAFPRAVAPSEGTPAGVTAFQANEAPEALAQGPQGAASVLAGIFGRQAARNSALSKATQDSLMQPKGKTLTRKALDAVFSNPSAFGALYEDQNSALR